MRNARVFISCGQAEKREITIGKSVEEYFKKKGFETYFAEEVHSSEGLTGNIFKFLNQSEYFVFVDFRREKLEAEHRGSLFVNQEIAIATFLNMPMIGFVEKGVKLEGILKYQICNPIPFEDGTEILKSLKTLTENWDANSVDELKIVYDPSHTDSNVILRDDPQHRLSNWYHLDIFNRNKRKHAFLCACYVTEIKDLLNQKEYELPTNELMWAGVGDITVNIMGGTKRELDAFCVIHGDDRVHFHQRPLGTTCPRFGISSLPKGKYSIEYTVISSNFTKTSQKFVLEFQEELKKLRFEEIS